MVCSNLLWLSVTSLIQICSCLSEEVSSPYECGKHGRFEYCIDGIPGCVIGCHCHPGYYFDTETKICEPNLKLSEDFKRLYMSDPNRIYPINTPTITQYIPTQTTTNVLNEKVEEMSKDTDDIGEWLYNQFFKTIESQVINNATDDKPLNTRRSNVESTPDNNIDGNTENRGGRRNMGGGKDSKNNKKKRKTRKFMKDKGKKDKSKVHGLRRKLLRITEDDSLFDSESRSDSEDSSSSSSSSGSSDSSEVKKKEDRDHGHKKVIIFNRRPRPPLPSFIFLPNMDSPYYPPIGLPPPPVLPMYPMVPVPPMAPFLPVIAEESTTRASTDKDSTTAVASVATTATTDPPPKDTTIHEESAKTMPTATTEAPQTEPNPETLRNALRAQSKFYRGKQPLTEPKSSEEGSSFMMRTRDRDPRLPLTAKQMERIKLVHSLKQRLKMKKKLQNSPGNDVFDPAENIDLYGDIPAVPEVKEKHHKQKELERKLKDVNFKYLSQLIHRLNGTESPPLAIPVKTEKLDKLPETRRAYGQEMPFIHYDTDNTTPSSVIKDHNDEYFMNLGRQIAALIRDEDAKLGHMATETTEANSMQESIHSILNENRYAPRSYWERFVRSPLSRLKSYLADLHFYKPNYEMNLFSLEDEVNIFASTAKPLTLQDIENMLTNVQKNSSKISSSYKYHRQPDVSLNVNLMPKTNIKVDHVYRRMYEKPEHVQYGPDTTQAAHKIKDKQETLVNNISSNIHPANLDWMRARGADLLPIMTFTSKLKHLQTIGNVTRNILLGRESTNHSSKLTANNIPTNLKMNSNMSRKYQGEYLKFLKRTPAVKQTNVNKPILTKYPELPPKYLMVPDKTKPTLMNYKSLKYFADNRNNHHYMFEAAYPLDTPSFKESLSRRIDTKNPSYFHHEFHHFDYLD